MRADEVVDGGRLPTTLKVTHQVAARRSVGGSARRQGYLRSAELWELSYASPLEGVDIRLTSLAAGRSRP